jgi:hypothetical protein
MLTQEANDFLCRVGPGTPGGELHRSYWQPIALVAELLKNPRPVRPFLRRFRRNSTKPCFATRQAALVAAIERLYTLTPHRLTTRQEALTRLCGALHLGTTRHSLRAAERERLAWESGQR